MIKRNQAILNQLNALLDWVLIVASYIFSAWLYLTALDHDRSNMAALSARSVGIAAAVALVLLLLFTISGFYSATRTRRLTWKLGVIIVAVTGVVLSWSFMLYLLRLENFSRGVLFLFYGCAAAVLCAKYGFMAWLFRRIRAAGYNLKHQVVIGSGGQAARYKQDAEGERGLGLVIDRTVRPDDVLDGVLADPNIDEAVIALEPEEYGKIREVIGACEKNGVKYAVVPFYSDLIPAHPVFESVGSSKLFSMRSNQLENVGWAALKRLFDVMASAAGLLVLSPLLLAIAMGVKLSSPGPILFKQTRVGYKRKEFQMLKFRSMRVNDKEDTAWSTDTDGRRTRFGSFIRKFSLDELPQLWNVLRGDMSLVGPRPELPHFVEQFRETVPLYMVKHQVKPGITGWAQVNGYRGDTSIRKRIELDLWYIDHWSPLLDMKILFKTVFGGMMNTEHLNLAAEVKDVKIIVAAHKPAWMPADPLYVPVQAGAAGKPDLGFQRDDAGENISEKNAHYCELTVLYWAWKNLKADYLGLAHYRRHFTAHRFARNRHAVLTLPQASAFLDRADCLLPLPRHYWIETNYSQYAHAHHGQDLDTVREIIREKFPSYLKAFDASMKRTCGHRFNMFVMKRDLADRCCQWLFDILSELEKRLDISDYNPYDSRVFGFVAERLLDVWIETNGVKYKEIPYVFMEKQNWVVKGVNFVKRKMAGNKS